MKILIFLIGVYLINPNKVFAQDWGRFWCFGDSAGINFSNVFSPTNFTSSMDCSQSSSSIGDSTNGLLMYSHTTYWPYWVLGSIQTAVILNSSHQVMINGDSLKGDGFHNGQVFIPKPENDSVFYLFQYGFNPDDGLFYSVVEPYYNNKQGRVTSKNISLPLSISQLQWGLLGVKHGNGRDWWVIGRNGYQSNKFNLFLITPDSVLGPFEQDIGSITSTDAGMLSISKNGDKIVLVNQSGLIETYSFDRCSGLIGNVVTFSGVPFTKFFGCEFSPNGNLLYVSNTNNIFGGDSLKLFQFDLTHSNPSSTLQVIYKNPVPASGGLLKRGPDDKIYFSCLHEYGWPYADSVRNMYNENLSVINNPDVYGQGCNFSPFSFYLGGKRAYWNLPNNPNFLLGPLSGSICDSITNDISVIDENNFTIYPNPATDHLYVSGDFSNDDIYKIFNIEGKLIDSYQINSMLFNISVSDLEPSIYYLSINNSKFKKFIIIR